jgi:putative cardiolipin synthase
MRKQRLVLPLLCLMALGIAARIPAAPEPPAGSESPFRELVAKAFPEAGKPAPHFVRILNNGTDALLARLAVIRSARRTIVFQTYIWGEDELSAVMFRELLAAARRGVDVKIVIDQVGVKGKGVRQAMAAVAHPNLKIRIYNPTFNELRTSPRELFRAVLFRFSQFNRRMHNKVLVIDDEIAITGGRNIKNEYFDMDPNYTYKDRDAPIMAKAIMEYWDFDHSIPLERLQDIRLQLDAGVEYQPAAELSQSPLYPYIQEIDRKAGDGPFIARTLVAPLMTVNGAVEFYCDPPLKDTSVAGRPVESTHDGLLKIVSQARRSIVIQTPYLVFTRRPLRNLAALRKQAPELRIQASSNSFASADVIPVYAIAQKQRKRMLDRLGFELHDLKPFPGDRARMMPRYPDLVKENAIARGVAAPAADDAQAKGPVMALHAKSLVVDDRVAWIGSHNFDPRSSMINTEAALAIHDEAVARALKEDILRDMAPQNSWVVAKEERWPVVGELNGFMMAVSNALPVLDLWPALYATSYELNEGASPVAPNQPEFHQRYRDVGPFPEASFVKRARLRIAKAIGGWILSQL